MTFTARFKVEDVGDGPAPIDIEAIAAVEDGTLTQNTEKARLMRLSIQLEADETSISIGDTITVTGHFTS